MGPGSLYAMGLNYSLTGVFYNKEMAAQIGMTEAPKTLTRVRCPLAAAKDAGLKPIMIWGSAKSGMGLAFPLQQHMSVYGPVGRLTTGSSINQMLPSTHLRTCWQLNTSKDGSEAGYFPSTLMQFEYTDAAARFGAGEGVFTFNGDWQNAGYDSTMPGNVGFFLIAAARRGVALLLPCLPPAHLWNCSRLQRMQIARVSSSIGSPR